jgi:hypothetical protein
LIRDLHEADAFLDHLSGEHRAMIAEVFFGANAKGFLQSCFELLNGNSCNLRDL